MTAHIPIRPLRSSFFLPYFFVLLQYFMQTTIYKLSQFFRNFSHISLRAISLSYTFSIILFHTNRILHRSFPHFFSILSSIKISDNCSSIIFSIIYKIFSNISIVKHLAITKSLFFLDTYSRTFGLPNIFSICSK